ncbi:MAG: hypothetical protein ACOC89_03105 [Candidatus Saliniplasma sp.]
MKYLYTRCPHCRANSYVRVKDEKLLKIECPYCGQEYTDEVREEYVKDADFYWELYGNLYPPLKDKFRGEKTLKFAAFLLTLSIPFHLFTIISIMVEPGVQSSVGSSPLYGLLLSSMVFLGIITIGTASVYLRYSFPIAAVGAFFGVMNSVLWYVYGLNFHLNLLIFSIDINSISTFLLSSLSLLIIVHARWTFFRS